MSAPLQLRRLNPEAHVYVIDAGAGVGFVGWARRDFIGKTGITGFLDQGQAMAMAEMVNGTLLVYELADLDRICREQGFPLLVKTAEGQHYIISHEVI